MENTNLKEELETLIVMGRHCKLIFLNQLETVNFFQDRVVGLYEFDNELCLITEKGLKIPLSRIIEVNGKIFQFYG